jgi:hypothetical protein
MRNSKSTICLYLFESMLLQNENDFEFKPIENNIIRESISSGGVLYTL